MIIAIYSKFSIPKLSLYTLFIYFIRGVGVFASKSFQSRSFLLQYSGELITEAEEDRQEKEYAKSSKECYMYFFELEERSVW